MHSGLERKFSYPHQPIGGIRPIGDHAFYDHQGRIALWRTSQHPGQANLLLLEKFFRPFASLPFNEGCAECYAGIRSELASQGKPIGPHDLLIAATARAHDLTLVTHNTREFLRVVGLRVEDWE